ncbi:MAG: ferritin family protein [Anaerolineae bacterium]|jgi:rubrerythrin
MALLVGDEVFEIAVRLEENGESFYKAAAKGATTDAVKTLFQDLAIQEQYHRRAFQGMASGKLDLTFTAEQWEQFQAYADALLRNELFDSPGGALDRAGQAQDEREVLQAAIGFEKETLLFYYEIKDVVRDADREAIDRIVQEEKQHILRLSTMLASIPQR